MVSPYLKKPIRTVDEAMLDAMDNMRKFMVGRDELIHKLTFRLMNAETRISELEARIASMEHQVYDPPWEPEEPPVA